MRTHSIYAIFCFCFFCTTSLCAQESITKHLESYVPGQGRVKVHQDARIEALIGAPYVATTSEDATLKMAGYRVQVYSGGNSRTSKNEAENVAEKVKESFPDVKVYTKFNPPRWLCQVGDFLSIEEADAMMRKLRKEGGFKEVTIVKDQVNIYL